MDKIVPFERGYFAFRYVNYRLRNMKSLEERISLNNERYEGYMRGDFRIPKLKSEQYVYDKVEIVRI